MSEQERVAAIKQEIRELTQKALRISFEKSLK